MTIINRMIITAKSQTLSPRDQLIVDNLPLVVGVLRNQGIPITDDNLQLGFIGLIKAVDKYDSSRGCKLASFAYRIICTTIWREAKGKAFRQKVNENNEINEATEPTLDEVPIELVAERKELCDRILDAMLPQDKALVIEHFYEAKSHPEMAKARGVSKQNLNYKILRGLKAARHALRKVA